MPMFTHGEIAEIRSLRRQGMRMASICKFYAHHPRDEIVEAMDAIVRWENNHDARIWVNVVLARQASHIPLVNGREAHRVTPHFNRVHYAPMF
jgi:hypothetical protein